MHVDHHRFFLHEPSASFYPRAGPLQSATTVEIDQCPFNGQEYRVNYLAAEPDTGMFGGNSNWHGPIWMPVNALLIRALLQYYLYYRDNFKIECPTARATR
jgi:hypothetical protein